MSTFHRPKVYKSIQGCCICKAKSSSSRFTDSTKYENDLFMCFQLSSLRQGEICNACVLLVKRFKRLPVGSSQHWGHMVDAREGPGVKCLSRVKKGCKESQSSSKSDECEGHMSVKEEFCSDDEPGSYDDNLMMMTCRKRQLQQPKRNYVNPVHSIPFLDKTVWKKVTICCGDMWKNSYGRLALELSSLHPCRLHTAVVKKTVFETNIKKRGGITILGKVNNDNSCDSGYAECSNPSPGDPTIIPL